MIQIIYPLIVILDLRIIFYYIYLCLIFLIVITFSAFPEWLTGFQFGIIAVETTKVLYYYGWVRNIILTDNIFPQNEPLLYNIRVECNFGKIIISTATSQQKSGVRNTTPSLHPIYRISSLLTGLLVNSEIFSPCNLNNPDAYNWS